MNQLLGSSPAPGPQVAPAHYGSTYDHKRRFVSYWNQIDHLRRADPQNLLEVGIGNGFVTRYMREQGVRTHTVDFDARLGPDTVASVTALPFADDAFDVACCFETLEHLPKVDFVRALRELRRVSSGKVVVSLPDVTPYFRVHLTWGFLRPLIEFCRDYRKMSPKIHRFDGQHYWEIGKRGSLLQDVQSEFGAAGLQVLSTHRDYDDPYHRIFVCEESR